MPIEHLDGFDHYGPDYSLMLQGGNAAYAEIGPGVGGGLSTVNPRTGPYCFRIGSLGFLRRVYDSGDTFYPGLGYAFYLPDLPDQPNSLAMASFRDINNHEQFAIVLSTDGRLQLMKNSVVLAQSAICVFAKGYQHFEVRGLVDDVAGGAECRINGVTRLNHFGLNTVQFPDTGNVSQYRIGQVGTVNPMPDYMDVDDLSGVTSVASQITDFLGDKKVYRRMPNMDTAQNDWIPSVGSTSYPMVSNVPPEDDDLF